MKAGDGASGPRPCHQAARPRKCDLEWDGPGGGAGWCVPVVAERCVPLSDGVGDRAPVNVAQVAEEPRSRDHRPSRVRPCRGHATRPAGRPRRRLFAPSRSHRPRLGLRLHRSVPIARRDVLGHVGGILCPGQGGGSTPRRSSQAQAADTRHLADTASEPGPAVEAGCIDVDPWMVGPKGDRASPVRGSGTRGRSPGRRASAAGPSRRTAPWKRRGRSWRCARRWGADARVARVYRVQVALQVRREADARTLHAVHRAVKPRARRGGAA